MKIKLIFLFLLLSLSYSTQAQDSLSQQNVQLIDGSVFKAQILEQGIDFTRVKIISGDVLLLNNELIKSIGEVSILKPEKLVRRSALQHKGNYNIISVGVLAGRDSNLDFNIGSSILSFIKGYQFNQYLGVGAGVGLDVYDDNFVPLHLDFRGNFNIKESTMYYTLQTGYSFSAQDFGSNDDIQLNGGFLVYPAIGVKIPSSTNLDLILEFGYRRQNATREFSWNENKDEIVFQRYSFKIGMMF